MKGKDKFYLIVILIAGVIGGLFYFGILGDIVVKEQEAGPFKVVYETHLGDYAEAGAIHDGIYSSLVEDGINTTKGFGIYYDNPKEVEKSKLRSEVGVIIEEADYSRALELKEKYNIKDIPKSSYAIATFPYRNKYSIMIGVFKVYPKLNAYLEEKGYSLGPAMEVYDSANNRIVYLFEIID